MTIPKSFSGLPLADRTGWSMGGPGGEPWMSP